MTIWQAAALGEMAELNRLLGETAPDSRDITNACWHACRGGQLAAVETLVASGADLDWLGYDHLTCRQAGLESGDEALVAWLHSR